MKKLIALLIGIYLSFYPSMRIYASTLRESHLSLSVDSVYRDTLLYVDDNDNAWVPIREILKILGTDVTYDKLYHRLHIYTKQINTELKDSEQVIESLVDFIKSSSEISYDTYMMVLEYYQDRLRTTNNSHELYKLFKLLENEEFYINGDKELIGDVIGEILSNPVSEAKKIDINNLQISIDGVYQTDIPKTIANNYNYVPLRQLMDKLGYTIEYSQKYAMIYINSTTVSLKKIQQSVYNIVNYKMYLLASSSLSKVDYDICIRDIRKERDQIKESTMLEIENKVINNLLDLRDATFSKEEQIMRITGLMYNIEEIK